MRDSILTTCREDPAIPEMSSDPLTGKEPYCSVYHEKWGWFTGIRGRAFSKCDLEAMAVPKSEVESLYKNVAGRCKTQEQRLLLSMRLFRGILIKE